MQIIENSKIKEKLYISKMSNGLKVMLLPRKIRKKYIIWSANVGSVDNKFYAPYRKNLIEVPDGIAHYLEHKLFEQENARNSLDVLTSLGVEANAYTTNNHTAFLFEATDNFDEALVEFMDYVQHPYFTEENIEKERGIIEQEIMMYDDYPDWALYMNAMKAMYKDNEIKIDVAGSKESIAKVNIENLYILYNAFYRPNNMIMVVAGDFEPKEIFNKIENLIRVEEMQEKTIRIYNTEQKEIVKPYVEKEMNVSMPLVLIAYKDNDFSNNKIRKDIAIDILGSILVGKSSELFEALYEKGKLLSTPDISYEFAKTYAHVMVQAQTNYIDDFINKFKDRVQFIKENGIDEEEFSRAKKKIYGGLIREYNDISTIANSLVSDYFKDINSFEYFEEFNSITKEYVESVLKNLFVEDKMVISVIKPLKD